MLKNAVVPAAWLVITSLVIAPGCWLFKSSEPAAAPEGGGAAKAEKKDSFAEGAEELKAKGYPLEESQEFTTPLVRFPGRNGTRESKPELWALVDEVLAGALAANPEPDDQYTLHATWAVAYGRNDVVAEAQRELLAALAIKPTVYIMERLRERPNSYGDIHAEVCIGLRPGLDEYFILEEQLEFYETCDEWVEGDHSQLWPDAKKDYAAIPKLKKKIAEREAANKAFAQEIAAHFPGGGNCIDSDCRFSGWRSYWDEEVESKCVSDDCFGVGWESATPKGPVSTRCIDNDCLGVGWKTTGKTGSWVGKCKDEECELSGWTVKKGGQTYDVTSPDEGRTYNVTTPKKKVYECRPRAQSGKGILAGMDCVDL
ncbi:MAG: hypothetical protein R3A79_00545 [Nannocystaceae bacterium]